MGAHLPTAKCNCYILLLEYFKQKTWECPRWLPECTIIYYTKNFIIWSKCNVMITNPSMTKTFLNENCKYGCQNCEHFYSNSYHFIACLPNPYFTLNTFKFESPKYQNIEQYKTFSIIKFVSFLAKGKLGQVY